MSQRLSQLGKDSLIYGVGSIAAKGVGIFVLPIYTRIFSPADYGTIEMLGLIASLLTAFIVMGMDTAQSYFFYEQKEGGREAQARVISSILQWRLTWGALIVAVAIVGAPIVNQTFFEGRLTWEYFALAFSSSLLTTVMGQSAAIFRLLYRPWPFIAITLSHTLLAVAIVLTLVLLLDRGIIAFFIGSTVSALTIGCLGWFLARDYLDFGGLHTDWWPRLLRFGAPLLPAGLAMYGMNTSGRWFLQYYHGAEALGLYAIGARFALLFTLVVEAFRKAWWPIAMDSMTSDDGPETFRMIGRLYMGIGVAAVIALTILSPWLLRWLTGPDFQGAWPIVGVLCWQSLFYGLYLVASAGMFKQEKTYINAYLMGAGVLVNIALNVLLVPTLAGMGAALATALTFLLWIVASIIVSERFWPVGFRLDIFAAQITAGAIVVAWVVWASDSWPTIPQYAAAVLVCAFLIFWSVDSEQRMRIHQSFQKHD